MKSVILASVELRVYVLTPVPSDLANDMMKMLRLNEDNDGDDDAQIITFQGNITTQFPEDHRAAPSPEMLSPGPHHTLLQC